MEEGEGTDYARYRSVGGWIPRAARVFAASASSRDHVITSITTRAASAGSRSKPENLSHAISAPCAPNICRRYPHLQCRYSVLGTFLLTIHTNDITIRQDHVSQSTRVSRKGSSDFALIHILSCHSEASRFPPGASRSGFFGLVCAGANTGAIPLPAPPAPSLMVGRHGCRLILILCSIAISLAERHFNRCNRLARQRPVRQERSLFRTLQ